MIDFGALRRPPRAGLPEGNVPLGDGRLLVRDERDSAVMTRQMEGQGIVGRWAVYHSQDKQNLLVIAGVEVTPRWGALLHVSLSYTAQYPSWKDIKLVKEAFYGDARDAVMVLARKAEYISVHPNCFHLWEAPQAWGLM
ncbi:MAG TPA: hypothetical protein VKT52_04240 [Ktedonobacterales bacterium]|nr:hypothetical protein [Ktedonobacterales bacterium]